MTFQRYDSTRYISNSSELHPAPQAVIYHIETTITQHTQPPHSFFPPFHPPILPVPPIPVSYSLLPLLSLSLLSSLLLHLGNVFITRANIATVGLDTALRVAGQFLVPFALAALLLFKLLLLFLLGLFGTRFVV